MREDLFSVEKKVTGVTGAGRGLGKAIALAFAERGAIVYGVDLVFSDAVPEGLADLLFRSTLDITSPTAFEGLCRAIFSERGRIDVLVNNAVVTFTKAEDEPYPREHWDRTLGTTKDLVGPCLFLPSSASEYMTGQDIYVDGGWLANGLQREID